MLPVTIKETTKTVTQTLPINPEVIDFITIMEGKKNWWEVPRYLKFIYIAKLMELRDHLILEQRKVEEEKEMLEREQRIIKR